MLTLCKGLIYGLETTYQSQGVGGMSSAFMVLEIMHTHHWETTSGRSDTSNASLVCNFKFDRIDVFISSNLWGKLKKISN